jgi:hypothetical protein
MMPGSGIDGIYELKSFECALYCGYRVDGAPTLAQTRNPPNLDARKPMRT